MQIPWHIGFWGAEHESEGSAVTTISSGYLLSSHCYSGQQKQSEVNTSNFLISYCILENTVYSLKYSVEGLSAFNEWVSIENLECNVLWDRF